jgi:hypothetical protein
MVILALQCSLLVSSMCPLWAPICYLFSLSVASGVKVNIEGSSMTFSKAGNKLFNASINDNNAGALNGHTIPFIPGIALATSTSRLDLQRWHLHFCHHSPTAIEGAIKHHSLASLLNHQILLMTHSMLAA